MRCRRNTAKTAMSLRNLRGADAVGRLVHWVERNGKWVDFADRTFDRLRKTRESGPVQRVGAAAAVVADAVITTYRCQDAGAYLKSYGYEEIDSDAISSFVLDVFSRESPTRSVKMLGADIVVRLWEGGDGGVAFVFWQGKYDSGPYCLGGDEGYMIREVSARVWDDARDVMLSVCLHGDNGGFAPRSRRLVVSRIPDVGDYIGEPGPAYYANRLRQLGAGSAPRSMLIRGPSGVGKSVLSRKIAQEIAGGARTLKITGKALDVGDPASIERLIQIVQPTVLLVDDVSFRADRIESLLVAMETIRVEGVVTILTLMDDDVEIRPGGCYFAGMRPGRIDDVVVLRPPDAMNRDLILRHYYNEMCIPPPTAHEKIVQRTEGMTAAYLREVAVRARAFGDVGIEREMEVIRYMAPSHGGGGGRRVAACGGEEDWDG